MRIESIFLRNYRVFRDAELADLPSMATVVGANGSGKSTLFDAMSFLKDALTKNVAQAVERRGGFRELVSRGESGPISIILHLVGSSGFPEAYRVDIAQENDRPVVQRELFAVYERSRDENPSSHFIDVSRGAGVIAKDEFAETEQPIELEDPSALAIKGLGQFKEYQAVAELSELLENWHVSDFHIQEAQPSADVGFAEHLSARGDNVAQVARFLYEHHRDRFDHILEVMRARVPGVTSVPHPVSWTQVWATRPGVARTLRGPRVACDRPASRGASTGCSARRTRRRRRARRRDFERPGRRRPAP